MSIEQFPDRLRDARKALGLTQDQLGNAVGVTKSSISAWENGRESPSFTSLPRLQNALLISLDELILGLGSPVVRPGMTYAVRETAVEWPTSDVARNAIERAMLQRLRKMSKARQAAVVELLALQLEEEN